MVNNSQKQSNTGYRGITYIKRRNSFEVSITMKINPKQKKVRVYIGCTKTLPEAMKVRQDFIQSLF